MHFKDTPLAIKPETVICRGSFIAFSEHSEFKDKLFFFFLSQVTSMATYDPLSVISGGVGV